MDKPIPYQNQRYISETLDKIHDYLTKYIEDSKREVYEWTHDKTVVQLKLPIGQLRYVADSTHIRTYHNGKLIETLNLGPQGEYTTLVGMVPFSDKVLSRHIDILERGYSLKTHFGGFSSHTQGKS